MITTQRVIKAVGKHASRALLAARAVVSASRPYYCPACGNQIAGFFRYGSVAQWGCPKCKASPRERLINHLIDVGVLVLPNEGAILHMAPNEASLVARFGEAAEEYVPADIDPSRYRVEGVRSVDLMEMDDRGTYDLFYASHVMEHVPDDAWVLRNIFDALKPGGEAWLLVPLWDEPTEEGTPGMKPREREKRFGQWDHVRQYGPDFADHIRAAGFEVDMLRAEDCEAGEVERQALGDVVFRARKPADAG